MNCLDLHLVLKINWLFQPQNCTRIFSQIKISSVTVLISHLIVEKSNRLQTCLNLQNDRQNTNHNYPGSKPTLPFMFKHLVPLTNILIMMCKKVLQVTPKTGAKCWSDSAATLEIISRLTYRVETLHQPDLYHK